MLFFFLSAVFFTIIAIALIVPTAIFLGRAFIFVVIIGIIFALIVCGILIGPFIPIVLLAIGALFVIIPILLFIMVVPIAVFILIDIVLFGLFLIPLFALPIIVLIVIVAIIVGTLIILSPLFCCFGIFLFIAFLKTQIEQTVKKGINTVLCGLPEIYSKIKGSINQLSDEVKI